MFDVDLEFGIDLAELVNLSNSLQTGKQTSDCGQTYTAKLSIGSFFFISRLINLSNSLAELKSESKFDLSEHIDLSNETD